MMDPFFESVYTPFFKDKKILLGVTGSIAAVKSYDLVRTLTKLGAKVRVVLTANGARFVTPLSFETLTDEPCLTSLWDDTHGTKHIDLARWADIAVVAPATANCIARLANGLADDLLSTELLAFTGPILIAPAMNPAMWNNVATQANLKTLRAREIQFLGPDAGETACGEEGFGRMIEIQPMIEQIATYLRFPQNGKTVTVNLGPTRSAMDPVRYFTNRSSGKMGAALAFALAHKGYAVHVIAGPTDVPLPLSSKITRVTTTAEMESASTKAFKGSDVFFASAAVLDFEVEKPSKQKIKKLSPQEPVRFHPTPDILLKLGKMKSRNQVLVGFAAETENHVSNAQKKLSIKNCDYIFVNPVEKQGSGFDSILNQGWLVSHKTKPKNIDLKTKAELAEAILTELDL